MLLLRAEQSLDLVLRSATVHLVMVSAISACALAVAVAAAVALVAVGSVHWWRWRLGFDRVQLALVVACLFGPGR